MKVLASRITLAICRHLVTSHAADRQPAPEDCIDLPIWGIHYPLDCLSVWLSGTGEPVLRCSGRRNDRRVCSTHRDEDGCVDDWSRYLCGASGGCCVRLSIGPGMPLS